MGAHNLEQELAKAKQTIKTLQDELSETNKGLLALSLELEKRVEERTSELKATQEELERTNSELLQLTLELDQRVAERTAELEVKAREVEQLNEGLEQRVRERTAELEAVNRRLAESEERFELAVRGSNDGLWDWDLTSNQIYFSPRWKSMLGYEEEEIEHRFEEWERRVHPEDHERALATIREHLEGRSAFYELEHRLQHKDGSYRWILARGLCVRDTAGRPCRMAGSHSDITERKQAEERTVQVNAELARRQSQLEAANQELEAFAYSVSHDLRAPLRHIDGFAGLLAKHASTALDSKNQRYLQKIMDAARQMGQLIDDLLVFSRMGRAEMKKETVKLDELIQEVRGDLSTDMMDRHIEWTIEPLPTIEGDRAMLKQVFLNLAANAVKYTRSREQARIQIGSFVNDAHEPVVFVRDNGVGFDMTYAHKLFGVFQRLHGGSEFEGTGVGLANVKRIMQRHGGRVWAEGAVDKGATFYLALPS